MGGTGVLTVSSLRLPSSSISMGATEKLQNMLSEVFAGWEVLKTSVVAQEYEIPREAFISHLTTDVVTFVAGKRSF